MALAATLEDLRKDKDPENPFLKVSKDNFTASLKSLGLDHTDVGNYPKTVTIHPRIPKENQKRIQEQREEIWENLRHSRVKQVANQLEMLHEVDIRRLNQVDSPGIRPIDWSRDVPPVGSLGNMGDFDKMMAEKNEAVRREQARKATKLATDFLQEKKRMDEADQKLHALEKRLLLQKREKDDAMKAKRNENEKKEQSRASRVANAQRAQREKEDEQEEELAARMAGAIERRRINYSTEKLAAKMSGARAKQDAAFEQAVEQEALMLEQQERKKEALEQRLQIKKEMDEERLQQMREESQLKFHETQVKVAAHWQEWAENKLHRHNHFMENFKKYRDSGKKQLKEKARAVGDRKKPNLERWRTNYNRLATARAESDSALLAKRDGANQRVEEHAEMKYKCGNDVFSNKEVKYGTWGALTKSRQEELKKSRDAQTQALLFKIAENVAMEEARKEARLEADRLRQVITRQLLCQKSKAEEVFNKIQCEPDEKKIRDAMLSLGFEMPKLPEEDEEGAGGGESAVKPAF